MPDRLGRLVGSSPVMQSVFERIERAAASDVTVLLTGETGTGKELAALAIHEISSRSSGPFVPVNAGAIPKDLTSSQLFGHERGAFTGAEGRHRGKFEAADGGTLFLDEIAATDASTQIALLRALEEQVVTRLGSEVTIPVDVRFIAATNESLSRAIREGRFREDLFYRLDIFQIRMPPLRDRGSDILLLTDAFLDEFREKYGRPGIEFSEESIECIRGYRWPGNVRELRNSVQRSVVSAAGPKILRKDLPRRLQKVVRTTGEVSFKLGRKLQDVERAYVMQTLEECGGNKQETSRVLGISRKALYDKLARWGAAGPSKGDVYALGAEETMPIVMPPTEEE